MTDHVIQHRDTNMGLTVCSSADGRKIGVKLEARDGQLEQWTDLDYKLAEDWCTTFGVLALLPRELFESMMQDVPPEFEDLRPFLDLCLKSPGTAASFALLFSFALQDAKALRKPASQAVDRPHP